MNKILGVEYSDWVIIAGMWYKTPMIRLPDRECLYIYDYFSSMPDGVRYSLIIASDEGRLDQVKELYHKCYITEANKIHDIDLYKKYVDFFLLKVNKLLIFI